MFRGCTACRLFNSNRISGLLCRRDYFGAELAEISGQKLTRRKEREPNGGLGKRAPKRVHAEYFGGGKETTPPRHYGIINRRKKNTSISIITSYLPLRWKFALRGGFAPASRVTPP